MKHKFLSLLVFPTLLCSCSFFKTQKPITSFSFADKEVRLTTKDKNYQLRINYEPLDANHFDLTYLSSSTDVVTVNNKGLINVKGVGESIITATCGFNTSLSDSVLIKVLSDDALLNLNLDLTYKILNIGDTYQITYSKTPNNAIDDIKFESNDPSIALVTKEGIVKAVNKGNTSIKVSSIQDPNIYDTFYVEVKSNESIPLWDESQNHLRTGNKTLDFYNINDFHGTIIENKANKEPGIFKLGSYLNNAKNLNPDGFVLTSTGDMFQGSAESNIHHGAVVREWMDAKGFDAMCLGNHDFDWSINKLLVNKANADFPFLACNIIDKTTNEPVEWAKPYTTITKNGIHVGVIGAIGEGQTVDIYAPHVKNLRFDDPSSYVSKWAEYLNNNGADIILYLAHNDLNDVSYNILDNVDLVFGGHSHSNQNMKLGSNQIPGIQASCNGKSIGHIQYSYNFDNNTSYCDSSYYSYIDSNKYSEDSVSINVYNNFKEEIELVTNKVVSTYKNTIPSSIVPNIYNQYTYKYFKENYVDASKYNIFAVETNNARGDIVATNNGITYGAVYKSQPFDNYLCLVKIKGRDIRSLTSYSSSKWYLPDKGSIDNKNVYSYVTDINSYYYILMIDYIAYSTLAPSSQEIIIPFETEDYLPRNIVSYYLYDYPNNII